MRGAPGPFGEGTEPLPHFAFFPPPRQALAHPCPPPFFPTRAIHCPTRLATLEDSVKAALRKLTEQEKDNSRRILELEGKLGEKMKQQIEGALDNTVSSRLNSITESVKESVSSHVQKVQELSDTVAKGGRSWVFP